MSVTIVGDELRGGLVFFLQLEEVSAEHVGMLVFFVAYGLTRAGGGGDMVDGALVLALFWELGVEGFVIVEDRLDRSDASGQLFAGGDVPDTSAGAIGDGDEFAAGRQADGVETPERAERKSDPCGVCCNR